MAKKHRVRKGLAALFHWIADEPSPAQKKAAARKEVEERHRQAAAERATQSARKAAERADARRRRDEEKRQERARRAADRAEQKRRRAEEKRAETERAKRERDEARERKHEDLARKVASGSITGDALRDLLASGGLAIKNPAAAPRATRRRSTKPRRNPSATHDSQEFHCEPNEVKKLTPAERKGLPEKVMVIGEVESITYKPPKRSCRGKWLWKHTFTDRGAGKAPTTHHPIAVEDPATGRVQLVGGDDVFKAKLGIYG